MKQPLNVEIFNSLFISTCVQNAQSMGISATLIVVDLLQTVLSLLDLHRMMNDVKKIMDKLKLENNALIRTAERVLEGRRFTENKQRRKAWAPSSTPRLANSSDFDPDIHPSLVLVVFRPLL
ncbi:hypothetical protein PF005_g26324 [Phytophthora fragariae]|uniref:Uncharacterized protein n=1 Tax=Phytophthora fragariae TaxID=53985 RepID=A0A6A3DL73_9STRA|nr:hypothetical protein PF003_g39933 [Phytophthora fragariae]KAE8922672.1 hypothetical protein PF009_g27067 [Phytophthora fragariae]KAE8973453.1 hypothetical protein PF011_g25250 [Phytophthora fragariae]KAE9071420.1 hypothetical protein PF010_g25880 [Phytophthora fragariae]KAE9072055.1 hypothetical protein PF007_g26318 [Phytophthora fragariae]